MSGVGPLMVVEGDPAPDACLDLRSGFLSMQIVALILQGLPQALDEDVVEIAPLAIHRDPATDPLQPVGPSEGRDLAALIRVQEFGRARVSCPASFSSRVQTKIVDRPL